MPVYYKKVQRNSSDAVRFLDKKSRFSVGGVKARLTRDAGPLESDDFSSIGENSAYPLISYAKFERSLATSEELVETSYGNVVVAHQGAERKAKTPLILTYHDVGLNHSLNFEGFFDLPENKLLIQSFSVLHINAPGQEKHAARFDDQFVYPTMDQLAAQVKEVLDHFQVNSCIGFGSGAGANVLARLALSYPQKVDGLFLINASVGLATWTEWFYQKKNIRSLQNNNRCALFACVLIIFVLCMQSAGKQTPGPNNCNCDTYDAIFQ